MKTNPVSPVVVPAAEVLSGRHAFSFLLFALGAGAVNAGAFVVCERFVTHVTGTVTRIGMDADRWMLMLDYTLVLVAFIAGAMASVLAVQGRTLKGQRPLPHVALGVVSLMLLGLAVAGAAGVFGPSGGQVEELRDFALLCVLAFAMGLMNATIASSTAYAVRTTHMTGPATDFGVGLATAWLATGEERRAALKLASLRGGKIVAFSLGAAVMVPLAAALGHLAFALPAVVLAVATVRTFVPVAAHLQVQGARAS